MRLIGVANSHYYDSQQGVILGLTNDREESRWNRLSSFSLFMPYLLQSQLRTGTDFGGGMSLSNKTQGLEADQI